MDSSRGFTVLEVLVASALFIMLLTLLLSVMNNTTSISSKAIAQIEATRIARESLDLIGHDIASASLPWSRTSTNSLEFLVNSSNYYNSMFWQAPLARDSTNGNLAIVGYFVLRDVQADARESRFQLRRVYIEPDSTNGDYTIYSNPSWITASTYTDFGPATAAADNTNAIKGWVADGILGMWVRCLDKSGGVIAGPYDSRSAKYGATNWTNSYPSSYPYSRLPAFVEVALVCVSPREVVRITNFTAANTVNMANPTNFSAGVTAYVDTMRTNNPGAKSITSFTRKFRIYNSD